MPAALRPGRAPRFVRPLRLERRPPGTCSRNVFCSRNVWERGACFSCFKGHVGFVSKTRSARRPTRSGGPAWGKSRMTRMNSFRGRGSARGFPVTQQALPPLSERSRACVRWPRVEAHRFGPSHRSTMSPRSRRSSGAGRWPSRGGECAIVLFRRMPPKRTQGLVWLQHAPSPSDVGSACLPPTSCPRELPRQRRGRSCGPRATEGPDGRRRSEETSHPVAHGLTVMLRYAYYGMLSCLSEGRGVSISSSDRRRTPKLVSLPTWYTR